MLRKSYKPEEIVAKVRQVHMLTSRSETAGGSDTFDWSLFACPEC